MLGSSPIIVRIVTVGVPEIMWEVYTESALEKSSDTLRLALHISDPTFPASPSPHQSQGKENTNKNSKVTWGEAGKRVGKISRTTAIPLEVTA